MSKSNSAVVMMLVLSVMTMGLPGCARRRTAAVREPFCPPAPIAAAVSSTPSAAPPAWRPIAGKTVILDAGHGGKDDGATHFGLKEKDITLDLANRVAADLRAKGVDVRMTRTSDVFVPLPDRSAFANRHPNAIFVSIHVNASASNPGAGGVETFILSNEFTDAERGRMAAGKFRLTGEDSVRSKQALANLAVRSRQRGPALANSIQRALVGRLGEIDRGVKPGNLAVLRETLFCPAVLVEAGFLTDSRAAMGTEDWRRRCCEGISEGIAQFLRLPE